MRNRAPATATVAPIVADDEQRPQYAYLHDWNSRWPATVHRPLSHRLTSRSASNAPALNRRALTVPVRRWPA